MTPEQANEIISKWRGECRHEREYEGKKSNYMLYSYRKDYRYRCSKCKKFYVNWPVNINYSSLTAWDVDLYRAIEEADLAGGMLDTLYCRGVVDAYKLVREFEYMRATPEAKASALAQAIEEFYG